MSNKEKSRQEYRARINRVMDYWGNIFAKSVVSVIFFEDKEITHSSDALFDPFPPFTERLQRIF